MNLSSRSGSVPRGGLRAGVVLATGVAAVAVLLGSLTSCDSLWGRYAADNPMSCVISASVCPVGTHCSESTGLCEPGTSHPLALSAVQPDRGPLAGGATVTLSGDGFLPGTRVRFGGTEATLVGVASENTLVVTLPRHAGPPALVDITVLSPTGTEVSLPGSFRYYYGSVAFTQSAVYRVAAGPQGLAIGDVNGDSALDLAISGSSSSSISFLLGRGDGTFGSAQDLPTQRDALRLALADLSRDGKLDLVYNDAMMGGVVVRLGNGDGSFRTATSYTGGRTARGLAVADACANQAAPWGAYTGSRRMRGPRAGKPSAGNGFYTQRKVAPRGLSRARQTRVSSTEAAGCAAGM